MQRFLLARHALRSLGRLEGQRSRCVPPTVRRPARAGSVAGAFLREVAGACSQVTLSTGERVRGSGDVLRGRAGRRSQLLEARQPQGQLPASADVRRGRREVVPRFDAKPQRVARQQTTLGRVEIPLHDGPLSRTGHIERFMHRGPDLPRLAHAPAHNLEPREAMIVARIDHEWLAEASCPAPGSGR